MAGASVNGVFYPESGPAKRPVRLNGTVYYHKPSRET